MLFPPRPAPSSHRLHIATMALIVTTLGLAGCAKPLRPLKADGSWCYSLGSPLRHKQYCSDGPVPGEAQETLAKRLEPVPDAFTVFVVRNRRSDAANAVDLEVDGRTAVRTLPQSFVRIRLDPGVHQLGAGRGKTDDRIVVDGRAGEVRFIELTGRVRTWASTYRFELGDESSAQRVRSARLVADLRLCSTCGE